MGENLRPVRDTATIHSEAYVRATPRVPVPVPADAQTAGTRAGSVGIPLLPHRLNRDGKSLCTAFSDIMIRLEAPQLF
jgi:hypothetical protein